VSTHLGTAIAPHGRRQTGVRGHASAWRRAAAVAWLALALAPAVALAQRQVPGLRPGYPRLEYADSLTSLNDRCMVKGSPLNTHIRPVYVNGQPLGFCCSSCPGVFVKDPERYMKEQAIVVRCAVEPRRLARIDAAHRLEINHELYYVHDIATRVRFGRDPLPYCGRVTDPVSRQRFRPTARSPRLEHNGRLYFFADPRSVRTFQASPDSFAVRKGA
jgi:YHS domain-containing protein